MDVMASDRKVWTATETRALIALKGEMKPKFETMKRNRALWVELSEKLRKHFGHERTPAQCAVRWKNIMSAYKDSRDALRNPRPDSKVCLFFKEVEEILGDPPLTLPVLDDARVQSLPSPPLSSQSPRKRERSREQKDENVAFLLAELIAKVDAQGAAIARIEKMLLKAGLVNTAPATDILPDAEPIPVPLPVTVTAPATGTVRPFSATDTDVLLERPATTSVPELAVTPNAPPQSEPANGAQVHAFARHGGANLAHSLRSAAQAAQDVGVATGDVAGGSLEDVVGAEEVSVPVTGHIGPPVRTISISPLVGTVANRVGIDGTVGSDRVDCHGPSTVSRPTALATVEPVVTTGSKPNEVQIVEGSVGGSTDVDMTGEGLEKEGDIEGRANKKQKVVHGFVSAS